jgi:hypothetical protein
MAMLEGVVTINPLTGAASPKTGCAGACFDVLDGAQEYGTLASTNPVAYAAAREQLAVFARAMAKVIPHIIANAVVGSTVTVTSVSGVTTGAGVSGPGAGSATGTIT